MNHESERRERVSLMLGERDRRELIERAAERAVAEGRPVSISETARDIVRRGLEAQHRGQAA